MAMSSRSGGGRVLSPGLDALDDVPLEECSGPLLPELFVFEYPSPPVIELLAGAGDILEISSAAETLDHFVHDLVHDRGPVGRSAQVMAI